MVRVKDKTVPEFNAAKRIVAALYRGLLGREPDDGGLENYVDLFRERGHEHVIQVFLASPEFKRRYGATYFDLNSSLPMEVETRIESDQMDAVWQHIAQVWSAFGTGDALWSVITDKRYKTVAEPGPDIIEEFYNSGKADMDYLDAFLDRAGLKGSKFEIVAEYGCGVGRVSKWLAPRGRCLRAFDISPPHIRLAQQHLQESGVRNVHFVHVRDRSALTEMAGIDFFFSVLVLQHNPPPVVLDILEHAFKGLKAGGIAFFQVPTYAAGYRFNLTEYWLRGADQLGGGGRHEEASKKDVEIHFVPQAKIFALAFEHGLVPLEVMPDQFVGNHGSWISNTFLLRKKG